MASFNSIMYMKVKPVHNNVDNPQQLKRKSYYLKMAKCDYLMFNEDLIITIFNCYNKKIGILLFKRRQWNWLQENKFKGFYLLLSQQNLINH